MWAFVEIEMKYKHAVEDGGHARVVAFVELTKVDHL